jgi:ABC-type transport system involved in cytochrome c biogenesis permease component
LRLLVSKDLRVEYAGFDGLRLSPAPRWLLALGKTIAGAVLAGVTDLLVLGLLAWLSGAWEPLSPALLLLLAIETVGMVSLGCLFFAGTATGEEVALDLYALLLLLVAPLIIVGQEATRRLFGGQSLAALLPLYLSLGLYAAALAAGAAAAYAGFVERAPPRPSRPRARVQ